MGQFVETGACKKREEIGDIKPNWEKSETAAYLLTCALPCHAPVSSVLLSNTLLPSWSRFFPENNIPVIFLFVDSLRKASCYH